MHEDLVEAALAVRANAHAPYSQYRVGAAVRATSGMIYRGCNVENAAFPAGICAETAAIGVAVAAGETAIEAVAVAVDGPEPVAPCGICRQVLAEFGPTATVVMVTVAGERRDSTVERLLPGAFGSADLPH
jgi:cytidine deaminase